MPRPCSLECDGASDRIHVPGSTISISQPSKLDIISLYYNCSTSRCPCSEQIRSHSRVRSLAERPETAVFRWAISAEAKFRCTAAPTTLGSHGSRFPHQTTAHFCGKVEILQWISHVQTVSRAWSELLSRNSRRQW